MSEEGLLLQWVCDVAVTGAVIGCIYSLLAAVLVVRFSRRRRGPAAVPEPITLLKPLYGGEPGLLARLSSFCIQAYEAPLQLVVGVQDRTDAAVAVVDELALSFPAADIDLKIDARSHGSNRKVSNLTNMAALARHDVLVLSDSDIVVTPTYLDGIIGKLQRPGVGAVTCVYHGVPGTPGLWSQIAALSINAQFLPNAVVAMSLGLAKPCFGATIALRRETLNRLGGFGAFADALADDHSLGEALRAAGREVVVAPGSVGHACFHTGARELFLHQIRSARTIRSIDPVGYVGSVITNPLPFALLALATGATGGLACLLAAVICRSILCLAVERSFSLPRQAYWLMPLCDLMEFAVYVASFLGGKVSWKGHRYRVTADGNLVQDSQMGTS